MLNYLLPYEVWEDGPLAACAKLRDPEVRERFATLLEIFPLPPDKIHLAWCAMREGSAAPRPNAGPVRRGARQEPGRGGCAIC